MDLDEVSAGIAPDSISSMSTVSSEKTNLTSPNTFTSFSNLPTEIRLKIWKIIGSQPRNLDIWQRRLGYLDQDGVGCLVYRFVTLTAVPSILHATHESRAIGLSFYKLAFGVDIRLPHGITIHNEPRIYVNWDRDRILPMQMELWGYAASSAFSSPDEGEGAIGINLQRVAVRADAYEPGRVPGPVYVQEILIYFDPFLYYDRLKLRALTIEIEDIVGEDLLANREKKVFEGLFDQWEEEQRDGDEEYMRILEEGRPIPEELEDHVVGLWKKPRVTVGRMVIRGRDIGLRNEKVERWENGGWAAQ